VKQLKQQQQQQQQQMPDLHWATAHAGMCSSRQLAACSRPRLTRPHPVVQLQRDWAAHLQAAAAAGNVTSGSCDTRRCLCSKESSGSGLTSQAMPCETVRRRRRSSSSSSGLSQQPGLQRLQQLLAANAAVPDSQLVSLRQLDLSLEQLVDLQGLGQLCPQLTVSCWRQSGIWSGMY
jgi:hypothetical protein